MVPTMEHFSPAERRSITTELVERERARARESIRKSERKRGEQRAKRKRLYRGMIERGSGRCGGKGREEKDECVITVVSLKEIQTGGGEEERGSIENSKMLEKIIQAHV